MMTNLTESEIVDIKRRLVAGEDYLAIARSIGRAPACVWKIAHGQTHAHVMVEGFAPATREYRTQAQARDASLLAEKAKSSALASQLALAMAWGSAMAAELDRVRVDMGGITPHVGGREWSGESVVYFIQNRVGEIKIGKTGNLVDRFRSIRGESGGATLISVIPGARPEETALHALHDETRGEGEWFRLRADQIPPTVFGVAPFNERTAARLTRVCKACGGFFIARGRTKFCGESCKPRREQNPRPPEVASCCDCGVDFTRAHSTRKRCEPCHTAARAVHAAASQARQAAKRRNRTDRVHQYAPCPGCDRLVRNGVSCARCRRKAGMSALEQYATTNGLTVNAICASAGVSRHTVRRALLNAKLSRVVAEKLAAVTGLPASTWRAA